MSHTLLSFIVVIIPDRQPRVGQRGSLPDPQVVFDEGRLLLLNGDNGYAGLGQRCGKLFAGADAELAEYLAQLPRGGDRH